MIVRAWLVTLAAIAVSAAYGAGRHAQDETEPSELFRTIASLDRELFEAYNTCDLEKIGAFFTEDLEFYHDKTGLSVGVDNLVEATRNNICGKVSRELVEETMEVHPIEGYGALQMGTHRFHHPGREDSEPVGQGKFVHLWRHQAGEWKITRVVSYDHRPAPGQ